jgi:OmpA-OmpF porin, OOP family
MTSVNGLIRLGRGLWRRVHLASLLVGLGMARVASAQVDAERLEPAVTHDGWVNAEGAAVRHPDDRWEFGALLNYQKNPLIIADAQNDRVASLVAGRLGLDLHASASLSQRFALGLALPVFGLQSGDASPSSAGLGNLRLVPKLELLDDIDDGLGLAAVLELQLPTHSGDFSGAGGSPELIPKVVLDRRFPSGIRIGANAGVRLRKAVEFLNVTEGNELRLSAGLGYRFGGLSGKTEAAIELNSGIGLSSPGDEEVALEGFAFLRHAFDREWELRGGPGIGLRQGFGVPSARFFIGLTFTPTSHDHDDDGVSDSKDQCPEYLEDRDGFDDGDGCPDEDPDADHDGIPDVDDHCPAAKETINGVDDDDGCPDSGDPRVVYRDGTFVILDTIRFEHGSSVVKSGTHSLLNQVALTMKANPQVKHIRVEGHTDDTGPRDVNMRLSHERAVAVQRYLVERGVSPKRLRVRSFGPDRPLETGTDDEARAKNRRVDFIVE